jgi:hypothetical protein
LENKWLTEHHTSPEEIAELLEVVNRDLSQCQTPGLFPDWQLSIAYNAALQAATAALAAAGYRVARGASHHYLVIQSLSFTLGADAALVAQLDQFRKKRNILDYQRAGVASNQEANEMKALAQRLHRDVMDWLKAKHPQLLRT